MDQPGQQNVNPLFDLSLNSDSRYHLAETARWTKFIAIVGFIFIVLMIIYGIFMGSFFGKQMNQFQGEYQPPFREEMLRTMMILYTVIFGVIYFFPCLYTYRFSNHLKTALGLNDPVKLSLAFKNLKMTARYLGILTIIFLVFMIIGVIAFIVFFNNMSDMTVQP
jgi:uncharacterized protein YneF (UPF0154 family)